MTIVSGADPDVVERLLGQPVVCCFAVDLDKLAAFSVADRLSSRPRLLLWVDFQDATSYGCDVLVAKAMNLTMKRTFPRAFLIIPQAGLLEVNNSAILTTAAIVRFARIPMGACSRCSLAPGGQGPFALVTSIIGSNPLQFSVSGEIRIDSRIVIVDNQPSNTPTGGLGVVPVHWCGIELEVSPANVDPALGIRIGLCYW